MGTISESSWPKGWIPSSSSQGAFEDEAHGLLRMENLDIDEKGTLRINKGSSVESSTGWIDIDSIFGVYQGTKKYRYIYRSTIGEVWRNYNPAGANTLTNYDLVAATGFLGGKVNFLNALGHTLICAQTKQYKDNFTTVYPLGIPAPVAPTLTINTAPTITVDLGVAYTSIESSAFVAAGTTGATFTANLTSLRGVIQSVSATTKDLTNFGAGTGHDTPDDAFFFNFAINDADQLSYVKIEFYNQDPGAGVVTDYYWKEWDFRAINQSSTDARIAAGLGPFNITSGVTQSVRVLRSEFTHIGADATKNWSNIKAIRLTVSTLAGTSITFDTLKVLGSDTGPLTGDFDYVAVELRDTGQYLEFSPASSIVSVTGLVNQSVKVDRSGSACDSQVNQIWFFRRSVGTGAFLAVHRETGAEGFTPTSFDDKLSDVDAVTSAATNPLFTIEPYRTALPDGIIGMIWFRDRVIYLTAQGFFPSFKLDPGTYDARFSYELAGNGSEQCLFIAKLDVGTFIVATSRDFYRVTGTFNLLSATDGNTNQTTGINTYPLAVGDIQIQDVNIYPLGISDPAISASFMEINGSLIYLSSSGIRTLTNGTSTLINGNLDLLFRNETRYGIAPVAAFPLDSSVVACASSGNRMYWSLPLSGGGNRVFVGTFDPESGINYWRNITELNLGNNPQCMFREEDGNIIYGTIGLGNIGSLESVANSSRAIRLLTQYNFGSSPDTLKDTNALALFGNTGGANMNVIVRGLLSNGDVLLRTYSYQSRTEQINYIDIKKDFAACIAFQLEIYGTTTNFSLNYYLIEFDPHAQLVMRQKLRYLWGTATRKAITTWPFRINPLGGEVTVRVFRDGTLIDNPSSLQSFMGSQVDTFMWNSNTQTFGYSWEIELVGTKEFEFYEWLTPIISQEAPMQVLRLIKPYDPFDKGGRKTLATQPFKINCLGSTISIYVRADGVSLPVQTITGGDVIQVLNWLSNTNILAVAWEIELIGTTNFEFYGWLTPEITQLCPTAVLRVILPGTNFGDDARKLIDHLPFRANALGSALTLTAQIDGTPTTAQLITNTVDDILTYQWKNPTKIIGIDYELVIVSSAGMEFYEFQAPVLSQKFPKKVYYAIMPFNNFGKAVKKKFATWPFVAYTFGNNVTVTIKADSSSPILDQVTLNSNDIKTLFWKNTQDVAKLDWQMEIDAPSGMEFYKFMDPDILQLYPPGRLLDQIGPLDFNKQGLVLGIRLRVITEGRSLHYKVYDGDVLILEDDLNTIPDLDSVYIIPFPKGIDPTVCRLLLSAGSLFYRFSLEFKVILTGHESESAKYIKIKDANTIS